MRTHHREGGIGFGVGAAGGDPAGGVVPALPGLLPGAGATPTDVPALTVTLACPLTLPCVALICAVPGLAPVTFPLASTLATALAPLLHTTALVRSAVVLSAYVPVAVYRCVSPTFSVLVAGVTAMETSGAPVIVASPVPALVA
jgi:hypothetical protein